MWKSFVSALDEQSLTEEEKLLSIQAAKEMFITIGQICSQIT
jgi:heme oxygenase